MFTGLVEAMGTVTATRPVGPGLRLRLREPLVFRSVELGESVALNGCCLTVVAHEPGSADFEAGPETLRKTNLGELRVGDRVNLERALAANARLGGHWVQGHVDGMGRVQARQPDGDWVTLWFDAPEELTRQMVPKGSIAVDGVSLTLVEVTSTAFSVALIPHTLAATTLGSRNVGATVNLETDILGKYVLKFLGNMTGGSLAQPIGNQRLTLTQLGQAGWSE